MATSGNDRIIGTTRNDRLFGLGGDDRLEGRGGFDSLYGGLGEDRLYGQDGNDWLYGDNGDDTLFGQLGSDRLYGGAGDDYLFGNFSTIGTDGGSSDSLYGGIGDDNLFGNNGFDYIEGGSGQNVIYARDGDDVVHAIEPSVFYRYENGNYSEPVTSAFVRGGGGNDRIYGSMGQDTIYGEDGDDYIAAASRYGGESADSNHFYGGEGADTLYGGLNSTVYGDEGNDRLISSGGGVYYGGTGDDSLSASGDGGIATLFGGAGDDTLSSWNGDSFIYGGDGDDQIGSYYGKRGADGGAGYDVLRDHGAKLSAYEYISNIEAISLSGKGLYLSPYQVKKITSEGRLDISGQSHDIIYVDDDWKKSHTDSSAVVHWTGSDAELTATDQLIISRLNSSGQIAWFDMSDDGSRVAHQLSLNSDLGRSFASTVYIWGSDNDSVRLPNGYSSQGVQNGYAAYSNGTTTFLMSSAVAVDLGPFYWYGSNDSDTYRGSGRIDYLYGRNGNDRLYGDAAGDFLYGGNGNDALFGQLGSDRLHGGAGDDSLYGNHISVGSDTSSSDWLYGGDGNDHLFGGEGRDSLYGGLGHNHLYGRGGDDTLYAFDDNRYSYHDNNIPSVDASKALLEGNDGNDRLYGSFWGSDTIYGGAGDDSISASSYTRNGGSTNNLLYGGVGDDSISSYRDSTLYGGVGDDRLYGGDGSSSLYGEDGDDYLRWGDYRSSGSDDARLYGGAGADSLEGDDFTPSMYGGDGDDILTTGAESATNSAHRVYDGGTGYDILKWRFTDKTDPSAVTLRSIERIELENYSFDLSGGKFSGLKFSTSDVYAANADHQLYLRVLPTDMIQLEGAWKSITAVDHYGVSYVGYQSGSARIYVEAGAAVLASQRVLTGGVDADIIRGSSLEEIIYGLGGNDRLYGEGGADILVGDDGDDTLFGQLGSDRLYGGAGADYIFGNHSSIGTDISSSDTLDGGEGKDHIYGSNGGDLIEGGLGADWIDGRSGDDLIHAISADFTDSPYSYYDFDVSNFYDNDLRGGDGNDTIHGGLGGDSVRGGAGDDEVYLAYGNIEFGFVSYDSIVYGEEGNDTVAAGVNVTLYGGAGDDSLSAQSGNDSLLYGGIGDDTISLGDGYGSIYGGEGDDVLNATTYFYASGHMNVYGGNGNDTIVGGFQGWEEGENHLYGGAGDDTFVIDSTPYSALGYADGGTGHDVIEYSFFLWERQERPDGFDNIEGMQLRGDWNLTVSVSADKVSKFSPNDQLDVFGTNEHILILTDDWKKSHTDASGTVYWNGTGGTTLTAVGDMIISRVNTDDEIAWFDMQDDRMRAAQYLQLDQLGPFKLHEDVYIWGENNDTIALPVSYEFVKKDGSYDLYSDGSTTFHVDTDVWVTKTGGQSYRGDNSDERIAVDPSYDRVWGDWGDDTIYGGINNRIDGSHGDDVIHIDSGGVAEGGDGDDRFVVDKTISQTVYLSGGDGYDVLDLSDYIVSYQDGIDPDISARNVEAVEIGDGHYDQPAGLLLSSDEVKSISTTDRIDVVGTNRDIIVLNSDWTKSHTDSSGTVHWKGSGAELTAVDDLIISRVNSDGDIAWFDMQDDKSRVAQHLAVDRLDGFDFAKDVRVWGETNDSMSLSDDYDFVRRDGSYNLYSDGSTTFHVALDVDVNVLSGSGGDDAWGLS